MGLLDRILGIFGKQRAPSAATAADRARSQRMSDRSHDQALAGREIDQTTAEQTATRGRMEAELQGQRQRREQPAVSTEPPCPHTTLTPRWDSVADMGKDDKVTSYMCESCQGSFTAAAGQALQATETARVQRALDT